MSEASQLVEVDFSEVTEPVPAGTYKARITNAKAGTTQNGWTYIQWEFETCGNEEHNMRKVTTSTGTKGKGAFRLRDLVYAALGEQLAKSAQKFNPESLLGKEVVIVLKKKDAEDKFCEVTDFKPVAM